MSQAIATPSSRDRVRHAVCPLGEMPPGERKIVTVSAFGRQIEIGVFNVGGKLVAYRNVCPHAGAPVCVGKICGTTASNANFELDYVREGEILRCPWHGWEFDLLNGQHLVDEKMRLKSYELTVEGKDENLEPFEVEVEAGPIYVLV